MRVKNYEAFFDQRETKMQTGEEKINKIDKLHR